jgi:hypothetical protein
MMMYDTWLQWQEDAGLDSWISLMIKKRKDALMEVVYLQYHHSKQLSELAQTAAHLQRAVEYHSQLDCQLAECDGRLQVIAPKERKKKSTKLNSLIDNLSKEERIALIEQLRTAGT